MLRSVTLGVAISVLAAACALVEPPVPPGTVTFEAEVRNASLRPARLAITTTTDSIPGVVRPDVLDPGQILKVSFQVPAGEWSVSIGDVDPIPNDVLILLVSRECPIWIEISEGGVGYGC